MKIIKLIAIVLTLSIPFSSFSQDLLAYADISSNDEMTSTDYTSNESIKEEEYKLVSMLNQFLASSIEYPYEARENGDEGMVRAVVILSSDHSTANLKVAKGTTESLSKALVEAYNKLNIGNIIADDYRGRNVIPIKINFELEE